MIDDPLNRTKVLRGSQLPCAKLDEDTVREILETVDLRIQAKQRIRFLKAHIAEIEAELKRCTNASIAMRLGVHRRTIDGITSGIRWVHVERYDTENKFAESQFTSLP